MNIRMLACGLVLLAVTTALAAANLPTAIPTTSNPPVLTATETVLGDMHQTLPTPDGNHNISFKGMGDVVGAIVIDGKIHEVPPGFIKDSYAVSADGKRLAYYVRKENKKRVVVIDGVESKPYDSIAPQKPVFSPDSKRVAYIAQIGPGDPRFGSTEQFVVLNGEAGKHYGNIWPYVMFSPDSQHVIYIAANESSRPGMAGAQYFLVEDGKEGKTYTGNGYITPQQNITFSPDCKRLAFTVWDGKQVTPVIDGMEGKPYESVAEHSFVFSPDSKHIAFLAGQTKKSFFVVDGVAGKEFDSSERSGEDPPFIFSPNGKRSAYRAKHGNKYLAVIDGVEGKEYNNVELGSAFSPDSKRTAYSAHLGTDYYDWCLVIDGKESKTYVTASSPVFSADGLHFAFWARAERDYNKYFVIKDGVEGKIYSRPMAGPIFSPDGKHFAYVAQGTTNPMDVVVVDEVECPNLPPLVFDPRFGMVISNTFYFESSTKLDFVAMKMPGQQFVRETIDIK